MTRGGFLHPEMTFGGSIFGKQFTHYTKIPKQKHAEIFIFFNYHFTQFDVKLLLLFSEFLVQFLTYFSD